MDLPMSEYLDEDFLTEETNETKRKSTSKTKKAPPIKLGKYSLTAEIIKETETLSSSLMDDEPTFEMVELIEDDGDDVGADSDSMYNEERKYLILDKTYNLDQTDKTEDDEHNTNAEENVSDVYDDTVHPNEGLSDGEDISGKRNNDEPGDGNAGDDSDIEFDTNDGHFDPVNGSMFPVIDDERYTSLVNVLNNIVNGQKVQFRQQKRILEQQVDIKKEIKELKDKVQCLLPKFPTEKLSWPVADMNALEQLEDGLRTSVPGLEEGLKVKMLKAPRDSLLEFVKENLKKLFGLAGRFTWTGSVPKNAKHGESSFKASGFACIETLIECSADAFGVDSDAVEKAIKKGFEQNNEAMLKFKTRRRQGLIRQQQGSVSKTSRSNIDSGPASASATQSNIIPSNSPLPPVMVNDNVQVRSGEGPKLICPSSAKKDRSGPILTSATCSKSSRSNVISSSASFPAAKKFKSELTSTILKNPRSKVNLSSASVRSATAKDGNQDRPREVPRNTIVIASSAKKDRSLLVQTSTTSLKSARGNTTSSSPVIEKICDQFKTVPLYNAHSR